MRMRGPRWLKNPGKGTEAQKKPWTNIFCTEDGAPVTYDLMFGILEDIDGDGMKDVLAAAKAKGIVFYKRQNAAGTSWKNGGFAILPA